MMPDSNSLDEFFARAAARAERKERRGPIAAPEEITQAARVGVPLAPRDRSKMMDYEVRDEQRRLALAHIGWLWEHVERHTRLTRPGARELLFSIACSPAEYRASAKAPKGWREP